MVAPIAWVRIRLPVDQLEVSIADFIVGRRSLAARRRRALFRAVASTDRSRSSPIFCDDRRQRDRLSMALNRRSFHDGLTSK